MTLEERITKVLAENGIAGNGGELHGWRCAYPERYGECDCLATLVAELVVAVRDE